MQSAALCPTERALLEGFAIGRAMEHAQFLCGFDKVSGTPGEQQALNYLQQALRQAGIPCHQERYEGYLSHPGAASLTVEGIGPVAAKARSFSAATPAQGVEGPLAFFPPDAGPSALAGLPAGAIVLTENSSRAFMLAAQQAGAAGYIVICPTRRPVICEGIVSAIWGTPGTEDLPDLPSIPFTAITWQDGQRLCALARQGQARARLTVSMDTGWKPQAILVADIPAQGELAEEYLLIGGHVDTWHRGGTDTTAGCCAMVEMARTLWQNREKLRRSVRFCWWPGHSTGRYGGSGWYADRHLPSLSRLCIGYLNLDMIGEAETGDFSTIMTTPEIGPLAARAVWQMTGQQPAICHPARSADQSFWGAGLPYTYIYPLRTADQENNGPGSASPWWWHTEEDTFDKISPDCLQRDAGIHLLMAWHLCSDEALPLDLGALGHCLRQETEAIARESGTGLSRVMGGLGLLERALEKGPFAEGQLLAAMRPLVQLYMQAGPAHLHDRAVPTPPVPGLRQAAQGAAGGDGFAQASLLRQENRAVLLLLQAAEALGAVYEPALEGHRP